MYMSITCIIMYVIDCRLHVHEQLILFVIFCSYVVHPLTGVPAFGFLTEGHWNEGYSLSSLLMNIQVSREREKERERRERESKRRDIHIRYTHSTCTLCVYSLQYLVKLMIMCNLRMFFSGTVV